MKVAPGQFEFALPNSSKIISAKLLLDGKIYPLVEIYPKDYWTVRGVGQAPGAKPPSGTPLYYSWFGPKIGLKIFPAPAKPCDILVRYFPLAVEE